MQCANSDSASSWDGVMQCASWEGVMQCASWEGVMQCANSDSAFEMFPLIFPTNFCYSKKEENLSRI